MGLALCYSLLRCATERREVSEECNFHMATGSIKETHTAPLPAPPPPDLTTSKERRRLL